MKIIDENKLKEIKIGQIFKSVNKLIEYLGISYHHNCKSNEKERILEYMKDYITYESTNNPRRKNEIIITKKCYRGKKIKPMEDKRSKKESKKYKFYKPKEHKEFKGFYVYAHYMGKEVVYIGKGSKHRATSNSGRPYKIEDLTKIKILKRFGDDESETLKYEKEMIEYYKSIGQCKFNDEKYHEGYIITEKIKEQKKIEKINKLIEKRNKLQLEILKIEEEIRTLKEE